MAVSAMKCGLLPLNQTSMRFYGRMSYHDFEGPAMALEERERLARDLGSNNAMILRSHGLLACGESISEAFSVMYFLENACKAQVDAMSAGTELILCGPEVGQKTAQAFDLAATNAVGKGYDGSLEWDALLRRLNQEAPDYAS
jgi:ribulose-5-phosphate 4-epimerase/fuculose-1-phosphate aldolase